MPLLEIRNLYANVDGKEILKGLDLSIDAGEVHELLSRQRMNVSTSPAGHARLDIAHRGLPTLVRASVHYYNSEEEIGRFAEAVAAIAEVS